MELKSDKQAISDEQSGHDLLMKVLQGQGAMVVARCKVTGTTFSCYMKRDNFRDILNHSTHDAFDLSNHSAMKHALEFVAPLAPDQDDYDDDDDMGPTMDPRVLHFVFRYYERSDGKWFVEAGVMNDSMDHANGCWSGEWGIWAGSETVVHRKDGIVVDQTGWLVMFGEPFISFQAGVKESIGSTWPENARISDNGFYWHSLIDVRGEDHNALNTHQTGSPFNMAHPYDFVLAHYAASQGDSRADEIVGPTLQSVHERIGCSRYGVRHTEWSQERSESDDEHRTRFSPGRPGLLTNYKHKDTQPYNPTLRYNGQYTKTYEGIIQYKWGRSWQEGDRISTFGRDKLESVNAYPYKGNADLWPRLFHGKLTHGWRWDDESTNYGLESRNWSDPEHDSPDRFFAAATCTPSIFARQALLTSFNQSVQTGPDGHTYYPGADHSYRTMGWRSKLWLYSHLAFQGASQASLAKEAFVNLRDNFLSPGWKDKRNAVNLPVKDQEGWFGVKVWQLAVWAEACWYWYEHFDAISDEENAKETLQAAIRATRPIYITWVPGNGLSEWYEWKDQDPTQLPVIEPINPEQYQTYGKVMYQGTRRWCMNPGARLKLHYPGNPEGHGVALDQWKEATGRTNYPYYHNLTRNCAKWGLHCMTAFPKVEMEQF